MELIAVNSELIEIGPLQVDIDFEVGDASALNDFELYTELSSDVHGVYVPGTEFGGVIEYDSSMSMEKESTLRGWSWRGLLTQWFIEPGTGNDYKIVSGELHTVMRELLSSVLGGFFVVPETNTGIIVSNYQFERHCTVLDGLMEMLAAHDHKLKIYAKRTEPGKPITVYCEAVPIQTIEGTYDEDTGVDLQFVSNKMGTNHLICLGSGELQNRQRVDLYLDPDGNITETKHYTGFQERQAVFDYPSAKDLADLKVYGIKRFKEIASGKSLNITEVSDVDLEIGDIVIGRKNDIGLIIEKPIVRKILRISGGNTSIEYKVKGEG